MTAEADKLKFLNAIIAANSFDQEKGIIYYQKRIKVPLYETLPTALIYNLHDVSVSGYPGRDVR